MTTGYHFRQLRVYQPKEYQSFMKLCKNNNSTATREINAAINKAVKTGKLPSEVLNASSQQN